MAGARKPRIDIYLPPLAEIGERLAIIRGERTWREIGALINSDGCGIKKSEMGQQYPKNDLLAYHAGIEGVPIDYLVLGRKIHPIAQPGSIASVRRESLLLTREERRQLALEWLGRENHSSEQSGATASVRIEALSLTQQERQQLALEWLAAQSLSLGQ